MTLKEQLAVWFALSVAVHVTLVSPTGKVLPEAGVQTTIAGPHKSEAVVVKVTTAPAALVAVAVMSAEQVTTGGPSTNVTFTGADVAELPLLSVAMAVST
jgi:hypothetical protein